MSEKIIGYALLCIGIIIIGFAAFSAYEVFTKKAEPVQLFTMQGISIDASKLMPVPANLPPEAQQLLKQQPSQKIEIASADLINQPLNLYAHLFLMGFIATIGFKIASLGTMLVRPIVVKLKAKEEIVHSSNTSATQQQNTL